MSIVFAKAPLVELVAELRWVPAAISRQQISSPPSQGMIPVILGDNRTEEFFMRLGGELYQRGFRLSERLVAQGFPLIPGQPVLRFRSESSDQKSVLYQTGVGLFSVNAVPPYRSWEQFSPFVRSGVQALLTARASEERPVPFGPITLRYIDFFGEEFIRGGSITNFLSNLGISINLPSALHSVVTNTEARSIFWKTVLPVSPGVLSVSVGDGTVNGQFGVVLDTVVSTESQTEPELDAIMKALDAAHDVTNRFFVKLTEPIHEVMQPQGAKA